MVKINPREVAADALMDITQNGAYNNMALKAILRKNGAMPVKDRSFVTEIVNGTLRNLICIDFILNQISSLKTEKMKPWLLAVLRISVYQLWFMDKVPSRAVCNEGVKLAKLRGYSSLSGFVNGVLRTAAKKEIMFPDENKDPAEFLAITYSHPLWLVKMWLSQYSYDFVKDLCKSNNTAPPVTIMSNPLKTDKQTLKQLLEDRQIAVNEGRYTDNALLLKRTKNLADLDLFLQGYFHVQDESSMLAVMALDPKEGEKVIDVCAAPGGKSFSIAEKMNNSGLLVSGDIHEHKLRLIEETAARLGITMIKTQNKDASKENPNPCRYDKVLVDAPCSGFGLIRKKPDIKYKKTGNDIDALVKLQREILAASAGLVEENGILVYSTCTICKKENIGNILWFTENYPFELCDLRDFMPDQIQCDTLREGYIQLFPNVHHTDGFFIARLRRKAVSYTHLDVYKRQVSRLCFR